MSPHTVRNLSFLQLIDPLAQLLARTEERHPFGFNRNRLARPGISSLMGRMLACSEAADAPQLSPVSSGQTSGNIRKNPVNGLTDLFPGNAFQTGSQ